MNWNELCILLAITAAIMLLHHFFLIFQLLESLKSRGVTQADANAAAPYCVKFNQLVYDLSPEAKMYAEKAPNRFLRSAFMFFIANKDSGHAATRIANLVYSIYLGRQKSAIEKARRAERDLQAMGWILTILSFALVYSGLAPAWAHSAVLVVALSAFSYGLLFTNYLICPILARHEVDRLRLDQLRDMVELTLANCESGHSPQHLSESLGALVPDSTDRKQSAA